MTGKITAPAPARHSRRSQAWLALPALLALAALATPAKAQIASPYASPMGGFGALFDRVVGLQQLGDQMAIDAGWQALGMMQDYRVRTRFTGEFPAFVSPGDRRRAAAQLNGAYDDYRRSGERSSQARINGADNFALHGILGEQTMVNPSTNAYYYYVPNNYNHWYAAPQGLVPTNSETYQPWGSTQLMPVR
jgi:hypothetical protein